MEGVGGQRSGGTVTVWTDDDGKGSLTDVRTDGIRWSMTVGSGPLPVAWVPVSVFTGCRVLLGLFVIGRGGGGCMLVICSN